VAGEKDKNNGVVIDPKTGRNTGVHTTSGMKTQKGTKVVSASTPRALNLQGATQKRAWELINQPGTPGQGVSDAELAGIRGDGTNAIPGASTGGNAYAELMKTLQSLGNYSAGNINTSMDELAKSLQAQQNPYANFQAQNTQTTPELAQLLQSQGINQNPLQQYAAAINAQNTGQADAFQNQANTLSKVYGAGQQGMVQDVSQQRADLMNQLQGNILGTGKALLGKKAPNRNAILQMILEAMKVQR
jgi:hypothetical protein